MTVSEQVYHLATLVTRDDAGRHFTDRYDDDVLDELEATGLISIDRPVHPRSGIPWAREYWTVAVTEAGVALVQAYPEYWPES